MGRRNHNIAVRVEAPLTRRRQDRNPGRRTMSPVSMTLDLILAALLLITLVLASRLDRRIEDPAGEPADFATRWPDLYHAAGRAETGLAELRAQWTRRRPSRRRIENRARPWPRGWKALTTEGAAAAQRTPGLGPQRFAALGIAS